VANRRDDIELMQQFDGELPQVELTSLSEEERAKLEALAQMSEAVRTHLELAADDVDDQLDAVWDRIERSITANGAATEATGQRATAPARAARVESESGFFTRIGQWLDRYRSQVLTGAVCAGAAAALVIALRPPETVTKQVFVDRPVPGDVRQSFASQPAVVEDLDVADGSGMVLTIPGEEGENPTTVIWVSRDDMEGPI